MKPINVNNNAQDTWWWREVPCGGEGSGSNDCPVNSFLQKKSVLEKDTENSSEDISYEVWGNKTQIFYDALGRKTKASPETRRYLFAPPIKQLDKEPNSRLSGSVSFLLRTIDGKVEAWHKYSITWFADTVTAICLPSKPIMRDLTISLSFKTEISDPEYQNDSLLKIHEDKHIEIYNSLGNKDWTKTTEINLCNLCNVCSKIKSIAKQIFEDRLRILVAAQNKWDDDDKNNVSHVRINLQEEINKMHQSVEADVDVQCNYH